MLIVRGAVPEDADRVAAVHVRSWQIGYRGLIPDHYLDGMRADERAARYTFGHDDPELPMTQLAVGGDTIVGFVTTGPARDADCAGRGEVLALYVDPESWGRGIGHRLMTEARAVLAGRGFTEAVLWVLAGNQRAGRFYRSDGWVSDGTVRTDDGRGVPLTEVRYRRTLP